MTERKEIPLRCRTAIWFRLFAVQGSWNYETLMGTGIGFAIEPALRQLPQGLRSAEADTSDDVNHLAIAYKRAPDDAKGVAFHRPLCPWPLAARYQGQGDSNDAANWSCVK